MKRQRWGEEDSEDEEKPEESQPSIVPSVTMDVAHRYFIGKDYTNPYEKDFVELEKYDEGN